MQIECKINGKKISEDIESDLFLIDFLRSKGCFSVKRGCETSNCGLCSVLVDKKIVLSCSVLALSVNNKEITTLEGLQDQAKEFGEFMADEGADQCGYCNPGFIMNVLSMRKELVNPTDDEIKEYLSGNLCRCTGYEGQMRAIKNYLREVI